MAKIHNKNQLEDYIREYLAITDTIESLNERAEEIKQMIKKFMGDREVVLTENFTVNNLSITSSRLDMQRLKKEMPDVYSQYLTHSSYRRFSIKE